MPVRNRFKIGVDLPRGLQPFAALELFYLLTPVSEYRETRFYLGLDWNLTSRLDLTAYYMNQKETNVQMPEENQVLGLGISYRFWEPDGSADSPAPNEPSIGD